MSHHGRVRLPKLKWFRARLAQFLAHLIRTLGILTLPGFILDLACPRDLTSREPRSATVEFPDSEPRVTTTQLSD